MIDRLIIALVTAIWICAGWKISLIVEAVFPNLFLWLAFALGWFFLPVVWFIANRLKSKKRKYDNILDDDFSLRT